MRKFLAVLITLSAALATAAVAALLMNVVERKQEGRLIALREEPAAGPAAAEK